MMLRRAGLGLLVGAVLMASSGASAGPALVFEPYNGFACDRHWQSRAQSVLNAL